MHIVHSSKKKRELYCKSVIVVRRNPPILGMAPNGTVEKKFSELTSILNLLGPSSGPLKYPNR